MQKIDGFDKVQPITDEYARPMAGGYIITITGVEDISDKQYLKLRYDIIGGADDETAAFTDYYKERFERFNYDYPFFCRSYKPTAHGFFKGFITTVEQDNPDFKWRWKEQELVGQAMGAVLGEEEYIYEGKKRVRLYVHKICSASKILAGEFKVPAIKKVEEEPSATVQISQAAGFDVPF